MKEKRRRILPERAYRDFWLLIITALLVWLGIKALDAASTAQQATREIQAQRVDTIRTSCEEQNARHDGTIIGLDRLLLSRVHLTLPRGVSLARAERTYRHVVASLPPATRPTIVGHDGTILLIQQLAPKQNCQQVVRRATQPQASAPPIQRQYPPVLPPRKG